MREAMPPQDPRVTRAIFDKPALDNKLRSASAPARMTGCLPPLMPSGSGAVADGSFDDGSQHQRLLAETECADQSGISAKVQIGHPSALLSRCSAGQRPPRPERRSHCRPLVRRSPTSSVFELPGAPVAASERDELAAQLPGKHSPPPVASMPADRRIQGDFHFFLLSAGRSPRSDRARRPAPQEAPSQ